VRLDPGIQLASGVWMAGSGPSSVTLLNSGKEFVGSLLYLFMKRDFETLKDVPLDAPLRLGIAARLAYPDGSMTASGLRKEAGRGRLVARFNHFERI